MTDDRMPPRDTLPIRTPGLALVQPPQRQHQATMPTTTTCQCRAGSPIPYKDKQ